MSTISRTSSSILSAIGGKRFSGMASGLDTDELVKNMTTSTRSRIAKAEQQKQKAQWKMNSYRSISSKLLAFQNKFTSYSSASNLRSPSFFNRSAIKALGTNSKYVSVSGNGNNLGSATIAAVEQLATKTSYVSSSAVSSGILEGTAMEADARAMSDLAGKTISFKYNNKSYSIRLDETKNYETVDEVVEELNAKLAETSGGSFKLGEHIQVSYNADSKKLEIGLTEQGQGTGNSLEITKVDSEIESILGLKKESKIVGDERIVGETEVTDDILKSEAATTMKDVIDRVAEQSITVNYNGKSVSISLGTAEELRARSEGTLEEKIQGALQDALNKQFGSGRIKVDLQDTGNGKALSLQTTTPNGKEDRASTLTISNGKADVMKALGLENGATNRVNTGTALKDSGLHLNGDVKDYAVRIKDSISGKVHVIDKTVDGKAFDENTSLKDIMDAINASDANVNVTYLSTADKLSITSTQEGASGQFEIVGTDGNADSEFNLGQAIFGKDDSGYNKTEGQDAVIWVDYDGAGGSDPVKITRGSNTFDLNGATVTVSGVFNNVDENGKVIDQNETVSFEAKADTEKITKAVKEMVDAYNEILELANKMVSQKPDRSYTPLSSEQKEEMTEDEIKNWEEKAQEGLLFNDPDLRSFTTDIRFLFGSTSQEIKALQDIGITSGSSYTDNGKLSFDEEAFKAALESNLDKVKDLFTAAEQSVKNEDGTTTVTQRGGIMNNLKTVFDKYAAEGGKGIFVQMAGAEDSPLSKLNNTMQKEIDQFEDLISSLQDKLADEAERYYNKFSSLEVYISNMNSQSSWLSQQFGGQ